METMDLERNEFERLVVRFLEKTITDDELAELQLMLRGSEMWRSQFQSMRVRWLQVGLINAENRFETRKGLMRLKAEMKRGRRIVLLRKAFGYAAVLIVLLSVGGYLMYQKWSREEEIPVAMVTVHSSDFGKVFLDLGSGKPIEVTKEVDTTLVRSIDAIEGKLVEVDSAGDQSLEPKLRRLFTTRGAEYTMALPDGTKVWLNAESELRFPDRFQAECREVYLKGEAYFDVAKDVRRRFVVHSSGGSVTVLGTQFNVRDYDKESTSVTLVEGLVALRDLKNREKKIQPGQQALFTGGGIEVREVDVEESIAWKEGFFVYKEERLDDILKSLARWYDLEIAYEESSLGEERYTAKFERFDNASILLQRLEGVGDIKFEIKGNTIIVSKK